MRLDNLAKLVPFASLGEIETIIVDAIRHGAPPTLDSLYLTLQVGCFHSCQSLLLHLPRLHQGAALGYHTRQLLHGRRPLNQPCRAADFLSVRLDHRAGTLRFGAPGLESDRMRDHIAQLGRRLSTAQRMILPAADPAVEQRRIAVSLLMRKHVAILLQGVQMTCQQAKMRLPDSSQFQSSTCR